MDKNPINSNEFRKFRLLDKIPVASNVNLYRFQLNGADQTLNLPIGAHIRVRANLNGEDTERSYSPIAYGVHGHFDLYIKHYPQNPSPLCFSNYLNTLIPGKDSLEMKGPYSLFPYQPNQYKKIGMLAGGSGITPMWQILNFVRQNIQNDSTEFFIIYANKTEEDIMLKKELDALAQTYPKQIHIFYTLEHIPVNNTSYGQGYITKEVIQQHMNISAEECKNNECIILVLHNKSKAYTEF